MRKPRDFDTALKALTDKTKALKDSKRHQLGELVIATGADALDIEMLAGGLLMIVETNDMIEKERWRKRGAAFFRKVGQPASPKPRRDKASAPAGNSGQASATGAAGET